MQIFDRVGLLCSCGSPLASTNLRLSTKYGSVLCWRVESRDFLESFGLVVCLEGCLQCVCFVCAISSDFLSY
ncbi:hypothetical protein T01_6475 [Trichinella spiralis]|uniref:Uncharacterized protein n=1 Tax=Trichinella spiralis TaxID=6334 RepID=A0A0V1AN06_TRISP|nr:hypothetical protein T01_6475 [Trichinella spiralis]